MGLPECQLLELPACVSAATNVVDEHLYVAAAAGAAFAITDTRSRKVRALFAVAETAAETLGQCSMPLVNILSVLCLKE